jgi:hypothetical protein
MREVNGQRQNKKKIYSIWLLPLKKQVLPEIRKEEAFRDA